MAGSQHETEIKLAVEDAARGRALLRGAGFRVWKRAVFEANTIFDTSDRSLRGAGRLLRVRQAGKLITATYKGPATVNRHKSREELEFTVSDAGKLGLVLDRLGYEPVFRYDKYRTEFKRPGSHGIATVDETPIGVYIELEGDPHWIDTCAAELGFSEGDYITDSYGRLYLDWCESKGVKPSNMVFSKRDVRARKSA